MPHRPRAGIGVAMTILALLMVSMAAEPLVDPEKAVACPDLGGDQLGAHAFIRPSLMQSSFTTSTVAIIHGFGLTHIESVPAATLGDRNMTVASSVQTIELGIGFTRWFGLNIEGRLGVGAGTDLPTLLAKTVAAEGSVDGTMAFRIVHIDRTGTQLTVRAGGGAMKGEQVTLQPLAEALLDRASLTLDDALNGRLAELISLPTTEWNLVGGLYFAQAFSRMFSLQASARGQYVRRKEYPFSLATSARLERTRALGVSTPGSRWRVTSRSTFPSRCRPSTCSSSVTATARRRSATTFSRIASRWASTTRGATTFSSG